MLTILHPFDNYLRAYSINQINFTASYKNTKANDHGISAGLTFRQNDDPIALGGSPHCFKSLVTKFLSKFGRHRSQKQAEKSSLSI